MHLRQSKIVAEVVVVEPIFAGLHYGCCWLEKFETGGIGGCLDCYGFQPLQQQLPQPLGQIEQLIEPDGNVRLPWTRLVKHPVVASPRYRLKSANLHCLSWLMRVA